MDSKHFRTVINEGQGDFDTLLDILPDDSSPEGRKLTMLIIAKRPAPESVSIGHYFQGIDANKKGKRTGHGPMFWRQLRDYGIIAILRASSRMSVSWSTGTASWTW